MNPQHMSKFHPHVFSGNTSWGALLALSTDFRYLLLHEWWYLTSFAMKSTSDILVSILLSLRIFATLQIELPACSVSQEPSNPTLPFPLDTFFFLQKRHSFGNSPRILWLLPSPTLSLALRTILQLSVFFQIRIICYKSSICAQIVNGVHCIKMSIIFH